MANNNLTPEQMVWAMAYAAAIQGKYSTTACQDCADWAVTAFRSTFPTETQTPEPAPVIKTPAPVQTRYPWHEAPEDAVCAATDADGRAYFYLLPFINKDLGQFQNTQNHKHMQKEMPTDDWQNSLELNPRLFQAERPPFEPGDQVRRKDADAHTYVVLFCGKNENGEWLFSSVLGSIYLCDLFEKIHNPQNPRTMNEEQYKPLPDWSNAPEWARWRAIDKSGGLFYYFRKPILGLIAWQAVSTYLLYGRGYDPTNWQNSLEARPEKITPETLQD